MARRYWVYILGAVCGLLWLAGQAIFQLTAADAPHEAFVWLNRGNLLQLLAFGIVVAALLTSNTRRPRGIDPDQPLTPIPPADRATVDAYSLSTADLIAHERRRVRPEQIPDDELPKQQRSPHVVYDEDGLPYGRRATDVPLTQIKQIIAAVQQIKAADGEPSEVIGVPPWARELLTDHEQAPDDDSTRAHAESSS